MRLDTSFRLTALAVGAFLVLAPSAAQQPQISRIRGTVASLDGTALTVTTRDGSEQKIALASDAAVLGLVKSSLSDIKSGAFIGVTGMPQADGSQKAVEVHIFPEKARGTGEGFRPWDLGPGSTMTNATVAEQVVSNDGQSLLLKYKDGEKKIVVGTDTPVVSFVDGDRADLKPGAKVIVFAAREGDGTLTSKRIAVGRDGLTPPM
ncbi:MAG: DUF5666 domain-containing protein [Xanthobacteraceae bacterium]|nr:DUF5666 domain-containing protein [Xanthobacteraceae bacterium]